MAFKKYDPEGTGYISSMDFNDILVSIKSHLLTPDVKDNLIAVARSSSGASSKVSYAYFVAFISLLNNMELIKKIYLQATSNHHTVEVTQEEMLQASQAISQVTPLELDILFVIVDLMKQTGYSFFIIPFRAIFHSDLYLIRRIGRLIGASLTPTCRPSLRSST